MNVIVNSWIPRLLALPLMLFCSLALSADQYDDRGQVDDCDHLRQFTFSWQFIDQCGMQPRGGTSRGAPLTLDPEPHPGWLALQDPELGNFERDRQAIRAMAGPYRTTFDFLEVLGFRPDFEPAAPYQSWGTEYVYVLEDRGDFISLQHIMVMVYQNDEGDVSKPMVMKHWRQDWEYENQDILVYAGNGKFEKRTYQPEEVAGTWSQSVYQVDDSPRYAAIGKWEHLPNFSTWESEEAARPLPRRESRVRDDYDLLLGRNIHSIVPQGWVHEQANYKVALNDAGDLEDRPYLAKELGVNRYRRLKGFDFSPADQYWQHTAAFWKDVREAWDTLITDNKSFVLKNSVDGIPLFSPLFSYAQDVHDKETYDPAAGQAFIAKILDRYTET